MLKTALRFLVLRVLPRRLVPIVTVAEVLLLLRSARRKWKRPDDVVRVNDPIASRTAPPPTAPVAAAPPTTTP